MVSSKFLLHKPHFFIIFFYFMVTLANQSCKTSRSNFNDPFTGDFFTGFTSNGGEASCYGMDSPCPDPEPTQQQYAKDCAAKGFVSFACSCNRILCSKQVPGYANSNGLQKDGSFLGFSSGNTLLKCMPVANNEACGIKNSEVQKFVDACVSKGGQYLQCRSCLYLCSLK